MKKRGLLLILCIFLLIPLTTSAATNSKTTYFYDSNGRIIRQEITNPDQIVLYRYDTKGRLLSRKVDRAYPTIPVVSLVNVDAFYINVKWTPSSDDFGLEGYEYQVTPGYRTGLISSNLTSLKLDGLEPNTSYSIRVRSKDIAGRYSAYQSISAKTWPADPGKPSTPTSFNYTINGSSANLSWGASFDPYGIKEYGIRLDGVEIARTQLLSYTLTNLTYEQMHTIHVYSVNIRGAASDSLIGKILIIPPNKIIYSYDNGAILSWDTTNPMIKNFRVKFNWTYPQNIIIKWPKPVTSLDQITSEKSITFPSVPYNEDGYTSYFGKVEGLDAAGTVIATTGDISFKRYNVVESPGDPHPAY